MESVLLQYTLDSQLCTQHGRLNPKFQGIEDENIYIMVFRVVSSV